MVRLNGDNGVLVARRLLMIGLVLVLPTAAAVLVWGIGVRPVQITSASMAPTVKPGEWIVVAALNRGPWSPEIRRGDAVLFDYPPSTGAHALKRVAAVSGDTVDLEADHITINGRAQWFDKPMQWQTRTDSVPPDHVYLLGDNSAASLDSRFWGPVSNDRLVAKYLFTLGSSTAILWLAIAVIATLSAAVTTWEFVQRRRRVD